MEDGAPVMHHHSFGAGPTVVLIHPHGFDSRVWHRLSAILAERFTVVVFDRPGHGRSVDELAVRRSPAASLEEYAERHAQRRPPEQDVSAIERMMLAQGASVVSAVGLGDGGVVALLLAARGHVRVDAAVLINTPVVAPADLTVEQMLDQLEERGLAGAEQVDMVERFVRTGDPEPWVDWTLAQEDLTGVPDDDRALMRAMLVENGVPAMATATGYGPSDLTEVLLSRITGRVLALRVGAQPRRTIAPIGPALPAARVRELDLPDAPGPYPLTHADDAAARILDFIDPSGPPSSGGS